MNNNTAVTDTGNVRLFTLKEVAAHSEPTSCWIVIFDSVYDFTEFVYDHPGGMDIIYEYAGTDATSAFVSKGHSREASDMLGKYLIGMLIEEERIYQKKLGAG